MHILIKQMRLFYFLNLFLYSWMEITYRLCKLRFFFFKICFFFGFAGSSLLCVVVPRCRECGLLFTAVHGLLVAVASAVVEHGLQVCSLQQQWCRGLVALQHVESSLNRDRSRVSCTGRQILNHQITREVPFLFFTGINIEKLLS